jgi:hypothetical protein
MVKMFLIYLFLLAPSAIAQGKNMVNHFLLKAFIMLGYDILQYGRYSYLKMKTLAFFHR